MLPATPLVTAVYNIQTGIDFP